MTAFQTHPLGRSDFVVPEVCLGTMTFGEQTSETDAHAQLDYALAAGIGFIDTAEMYAVPPRAETCGASESIVGRWLKHQQRDQIQIATKVAGPSRNLNWIRNGPPALDRAVKLDDEARHAFTLELRERWNVCAKSPSSSGT